MAEHTSETEEAPMKREHAAKMFRRENKDQSRHRPNKGVSNNLNTDNSGCVPRLQEELAKKRSLTKITTRECKDIDSDGSLCSGCRELKRICQYVGLPKEEFQRVCNNMPNSRLNSSSRKKSLKFKSSKNVPKWMANLNINFTKKASSHQELNISQPSLHPPPQQKTEALEINSSASSLRSFCSSGRGPVV